jgi:hypothetical protein
MHTHFKWHFIFVLKNGVNYLTFPTKCICSDKEPSRRIIKVLITSTRVHSPGCPKLSWLPFDVRPSVGGNDRARSTTNKHTCSLPCLLLLPELHLKPALTTTKGSCNRHEVHFMLRYMAIAPVHLRLQCSSFWTRRASFLWHFLQIQGSKSKFYMQMWIDGHFSKCVYMYNDMDNDRRN